MNPTSSKSTVDSESVSSRALRPRKTLARRYDEIFKSTGPQQARLFRPELRDLNFMQNLKMMLDNGWQDEAGIVKVETPSDFQPSKFIGEIDKQELTSNYSDVFVQSFEENKIYPGIFKRTIKSHEALTPTEYMKMARSDKYKYSFDGTPIENERKLFADLTQRHPVYASDISRSLFLEEIERYNLTKIRREGLLKKKIDGITTPFCYLGMAGTVFCAHREDVDLISVNYHHQGAPKYWIALTAANAEKLEKVMQEAYPEDYKSCSEFVRHKNYIPSTDFLRKHNIPFCTEIQRPGEIIITFPKAYHFGFNMGPNVAEAVNFACKEWIPYAVEAKLCVCKAEGFPIKVALGMVDLLSEHATLPQYRKYIAMLKASSKKSAYPLDAEEQAELEKPHIPKEAEAIEQNARQEQDEGQLIEEEANDTSEKTNENQKPKRGRKPKKANMDGSSKKDNNNSSRKRKADQMSSTDESAEGDDVRGSGSYGQSSERVEAEAMRDSMESSLPMESNAEEGQVEDEVQTRNVTAREETLSFSNISSINFPSSSSGAPFSFDEILAKIDQCIELVIDHKNFVNSRSPGLVQDCLDPRSCHSLGTDVSSRLLNFPWVLESLDSNIKLVQAHAILSHSILSRLESFNNNSEIGRETLNKLKSMHTYIMNSPFYNFKQKKNCCSFCIKPDHLAIRCPLSLDQKHFIVYIHKLCQKCTRIHNNTCKDAGKYDCYKCGRYDHHTSLCRPYQ